MKFILLLWEPDTDWQSVPKERLDAALAAHGAFIRHLDGRGIPWTGGALSGQDTATTLRPGDDLIAFYSKFASRLRTTCARPKLLHIHAIRIDDNLVSGDTTRFKIFALHFRDHKNTRRSVKVQTLVSFQ